jgi:hypothetical protein
VGGGELVTVMLDVPDTPPAVAVIVAVPAAVPFTRPLELTVATKPLLLVQVTVWPEMMLPLPSRAVAAS